MILDGDTVEIGDRVYDLIEGVFGVVSNVSDNYITASFGNGKLVTFNTQGMRTSQRPSRIGRTLYWDNPCNYFIPRKDVGLNTLARQMGSALSAFGEVQN